MSLATTHCFHQIGIYTPASAAIMQACLIPVSILAFMHAPSEAQRPFFDLTIFAWIAALPVFKIRLGLPPWFPLGCSLFSSLYVPFSMVCNFRSSVCAASYLKAWATALLPLMLTHICVRMCVCVRIAFTVLALKSIQDTGG